jgi:hypothetical protein
MRSDPWIGNPLVAGSSPARSTSEPHVRAPRQSLIFKIAAAESRFFELTVGYGWCAATRVRPSPTNSTARNTKPVVKACVFQCLSLRY